MHYLGQLLAIPFFPKVSAYKKCALLKTRDTYNKLCDVTDYRLLSQDSNTSIESNTECCSWVAGTHASCLRIKRLGSPRPEYELY